MNKVWKIAGIVAIGLILVGIGVAAGFYISRATVSGDSLPLFDYARHFDGRGIAGPFALGRVGPLMIVPWLGRLALLAGLVAVIAWALSRPRIVTQPTAIPAETALDVLKRRFAAGEIDQQQFETMKQTLGEQ